MLKKFLQIDRRWIFLITTVCIIIPFVFPLGLPMTVSPPVKNMYEKIDAIPPNGPVVVLDFCMDPSTLPELRPMAVAIMQHCFERNIRVIIMGLLMPGLGIAQTVLDDLSHEFPDKKQGIDYVLMPYVYGWGIVILRMGEGIHETFETDYYKTPLDSLPMMQDIRNYDQVALVVCLAASAAPLSWVAYAHTRYGQEVGAGVTAVSAPEFYPYLQTEQLVGMLGGLKGAAEYEELVDRNFGFKGRKVACIGMDSQSAVHIMMIVFILLCNVGYFVSRRKG